MRDKDQKSLEELYENRILSEISSEYYNSPDKGNKKQKYRKGYNFLKTPKSTRGLKPAPKMSGPFIIPELINLKQMEDKQEVEEYVKSVKDLVRKIVFTTQYPNIPENSKNKLETLAQNRNLCIQIAKDLVLGFKSDNKVVRIVNPEYSIKEYPNGDPVFIIVQNGENKFILVLGIKNKFVSGVSEYSDIKYKFV